MAADGADRIKELLRQKLDLLCAMRDLTEKQSGIMDAENPEMLVKSMDERQEIIDQVDRIDQQIYAICPQNLDDIEKKAFTKKLFPELFADIFAVLSSTLDQNTKNELRATEIMKDYRGRIHNNNETKKNVGNYIGVLDLGEGNLFDSKN